MDVFYFYTYGTAGWTALQSLPLIASPTMILTLLSPEVREATPLEVYFSRCLGLSLITVGVLTILLTGSVPLSSRLSDQIDLKVSTDAEDPKSPYALPTLTVTMLYHAACAFYGYALWTQTGIVSFVLGITGSGLLATMALWIVLFGSSKGRISRTTGMDKRTSGFPFKNTEAHPTKKKGM